MSANRLFVVCQHHQTLDQALCIAERFEWGMPYQMGLHASYANDWFEKHAKCGRGTFDHFRLAMHRPADHDKPVTSVGHAVKLTLVKDAADQELQNAINGADRG